MYHAFRSQTPVSDAVWNKLLTLPLFPDLKDGEVDLVVHEIKEFGKREF
jgi:dTDP-4-amino-4,6-dideoxygalactose transaminase